MSNAHLTQVTGFVFALVATATVFGGVEALADATPPAEGALLVAHATVEPQRIDVAPGVQRVVIVGHHQA
jgi:hypothetical protein